MKSCFSGRLFWLLIAMVTNDSSADELSAVAKNGIVTVHNQVRSKIAKGEFVAKGDKKPSATNMLEIKWDDSLEASAEKYAQTCPRGHSGLYGVGENLYFAWSSASLGNPNIHGIQSAASWSNEFQDFGWKGTTFDTETEHSGVGHATQMVWATTGSVGCAVKECGPDETKNNWSRLVVVCHYKPPGNYRGSRIYKEGPSCSECPSGTSCDPKTSLCH